MCRLRYGLASVVWMLLFANLSASQEKGMGDKPAVKSQDVSGAAFGVTAWS